MWIYLYPHVCEFLQCGLQGRSQRSCRSFAQVVRWWASAQGRTPVTSHPYIPMARERERPHWRRKPGGGGTVGTLPTLLHFSDLTTAQAQTACPTSTEESEAENKVLDNEPVAFVVETSNVDILEAATEQRRVTHLKRTGTKTEPNRPKKGLDIQPPPRPTIGTWQYYHQETVPSFPPSIPQPDKDDRRRLRQILAEVGNPQAWLGCI